MPEKITIKVPLGAGRWLKRDVAVESYASTKENERFVCLLQRVWKRIPAVDRKKMIVHWGRAQPLSFPDVPALPLFTLIPDLALYVEDAQTRERHGDVQCDGCWIRFDSDSLNAMPDWVAMELIAHELAHVLQESGNWAEEGESHAHIIEKLWGFSPEKAMKWMDKREGKAE